ncbi:NAD-dependent epimerase/dehydratase family protein [Arundinibacter roseus]|uniref:NAD-dependent epimerase/dehydratase family protein n=1 Tax=Arundinibacter roseus TaxID=2070510 RepID=A0A4R4KIN2_9BACT|nr:NAD-dependent epimerase/dehydratase family protein [Arundinibacter roseus]TDB68074.1 NAD-dependent epimerase/dehydratase family protein [Arundinibacter roseus]
MHVLITGATGLVGSATVRRFLAAQHQVSVLHRSASDRSLLRSVESQIQWIEGDILDLLSLQKALVGIDAVVHSAAVVSFVPKDNPLMFKVNVEGTANVVNACLYMGVARLCHVSSVAALGRPPAGRETTGHEKIRIDETQRWEDSPNNSAYAKSKYLAELEVWRGIAEGLTAVIVNPSLILGEGDWTKSSTQLFKYIYDEKPFYTEGTVNFVDVQDIAECIFQLINSDIHSERFILSAGTASYKQLFDAIARSLNKPSPRYLVGKNLAAVIWRIEAARSWLTGSRPLITKDTARSAVHHFEFDPTKIKRTLQTDFQTLDQTVSRIGKSFLKQV